MYCKHCGKEIDKNYVFCWHCRKRVNPISGIVFNDCWHNDVINAYTVLGYSNSGSYLIGNLGVGFVILDKDKKKLVIDTIFEDIIIQGRENVDSVLVKKNGKWGLVNPLKGIIICDFIYDDISMLEEDYDSGKGEITVYSNDLCGKIDGDGNFILPIIYDEIRSRGRVKYQGLWGCVRNGEQIIPCEYIKLGGGDEWWDPNKYEIENEPSQHKNGKWGVIDADGRISLEFEYDEITIMYDDIYVMRKGDKWGSKIGDFRFPCEFSLMDIKQAATAYLDDYQWTLYAENGRKIYLAADGGEVSCYTQKGKNQPPIKTVFGFSYCGEDYEIGFPIMYSHRYGNNIFLVGDIDPYSKDCEGRFYIYQINTENFSMTPIGEFAAVHFEKDGFKAARCRGKMYGVFYINDSYYDVNGKEKREDYPDYYNFDNIKYHYGESLVNAQKMVAL